MLSQIWCVYQNHRDLLDLNTNYTQVVIYGGEMICCKSSIFVYYMCSTGSDILLSTVASIHTQLLDVTSLSFAICGRSNIRQLSSYGTFHVHSYRTPSILLRWFDKGTPLDLWMPFLYPKARIPKYCFFTLGFGNHVARYGQWWLLFGKSAPDALTIRLACEDTP